MMGAYVYGLIYTILFVLLGKLFIEALGCTYRSDNREIRILLKAIRKGPGNTY